MGIVYSIANVLPSDEIVAANVLRSSSQKIENIVACYQKYQYSPMLDSTNLHSFFMNIDKTGELTKENAQLVVLVWKIFEVKSM